MAFGKRTSWNRRSLRLHTGVNRKLCGTRWIGQWTVRVRISRVSERGCAYEKAGKGVERSCRSRRKARGLRRGKRRTRGGKPRDPKPPLALKPAPGARKFNRVLHVQRWMSRGANSLEEAIRFSHTTIDFSPSGGFHQRWIASHRRAVEVGGRIPASHAWSRSFRLFCEERKLAPPRSGLASLADLVDLLRPMPSGFEIDRTRPRTQPSIVDPNVPSPRRQRDPEYARRKEAKLPPTRCPKCPKKFGNGRKCKECGRTKFGLV